MRIVSIDPGTAEIHWAALDRLPQRCARFVCGGHAPASVRGLSDVLREAGAAEDAVDIVAVERPKGYIHEHARGAARLDTSNVAGGVAWVTPLLIHRRTVRVVEMSKAEWTACLVGRPRRGHRFAGQAGDKAVNAALALWVDGMPKRSSQDLRDAIGLGVVALAKEAERDMLTTALARRTGT